MEIVSFRLVKTNWTSKGVMSITMCHFDEQLKTPGETNAGDTYVSFSCIHEFFASIFI